MYNYNSIDVTCYMLHFSGVVLEIINPCLSLAYRMLIGLWLNLWRKWL